MASTDKTQPPRTEPYSRTRQKELLVKSKLETLCDVEFRIIARKLDAIYQREFKNFRSSNIVTGPNKNKCVREIQKQFSECISNATENAARDIYRVTRKLDQSGVQLVQSYDQRWRSLKEQLNRYWARQVLYCCQSVSCCREVEKLRNVLREIIRERFSGDSAKSYQEIIHLRHNFYELINESLNVIANDHRALDVGTRVASLYSQCQTVAQIDFADAEARRVCDKVLQARRQIAKFRHVETETAQSPGKTLRSDLKAVGKRMTQLLSAVHREAHYVDRMQLLSGCLSLIDARSFHLFAGVEHFDEDVALEMIAITEFIFTSHYGHDAEPLGKQLAHTYTRTVITNHFQALEREWETRNSVMARFKEHYDIEVMWQYFVMVLTGEQNGKLFAFLLKRKMAGCLSRAFETEMSLAIVAEIKQLDWLYDEQSTTRLMDLHLLDLISADDKEKLVRFITSPADLFAVVVETVVRNLVPTENKWRTFVDSVKEAVKLSIEEALFETRNLASKLLDRLAFNFSATFTGDTLSREFKMDVQKEYKDLDKASREEFRNVCQFQLFQAVDEQVSPVGEPDFAERIRRQVMERLRAEHSPTGMPRCQVCCPMCRALCTREAGHDPDARPHDAVHQPAGLGGTRDAHSKALDWKLCVEYEDDARLLVSNGVGHEGYSFRDWNAAFRDWAKPHLFRDWPLREFILFQCHGEFAKFFDSRPCEYP